MKNLLKTTKLLIRIKFSQSLVMNETNSDQLIVRTNLKNQRSLELIVLKLMNYLELVVLERFT